MITKSARYWLLFIMFVMFALFVTQFVSAATFIQGPALIEGVTSTATAAGTTTLTKDSQTVQTFTGTTTQTVQLPDATTIPVGRYFYITNRSTGLVTVNDGAAGLLKTILPNMQLYVVSKSNGSAAGSWDVSNIKIDLADASSVTGLLPPLNGGTGINGSTAANGTLLIGNGTGYSLNTLTATANQTTVTNGSGTITVGTVQNIGTTSSPTFANLTLTNPLPLASGGTNKSMVASAGSVAYSDADSLELTAVGTSNQVLISNGTSAPSWASVSTLLDTTYFKQGGNSFTAAGILGTNDAFSLSLETNNTTRLTLDDDGSFTWTTPAGQNGLHQLGTALSDTNDIRIARGSSGLTPFDGGVLKVSNITSEAVARSQYAAEFVTNGQNASNTTTRYGGAIGIAFHDSAFNLTATDVGLVGVVGLGRATGSSAAATITNGAGGSFVIGNDSTNQVITNAFGVRAGMDGSITNTTNGVTNLFGYYMRDQTGGSTFDGSAIAGIPAATNRWGIYLNDPSQNYLSGGLLIGQKSTTVRTSNLPVTSAALELNSTTGALLLSRMTTTQRNALTAVNGMIIYNTTDSQFQCYTSAWAACANTPSLNSDLTLTASDTLAISLVSQDQRWRVQGNSGAVTMSTTPFGSTDPLDGTRITIIGNSDTNTVTFPWSDVANGILRYEKTVGRGDTVTYEYNASLDRYLVIGVGN